MRAWLGTTTTGHKGQTRRSASSRETDVREVGHVIDKKLLSTINKILIDKLSIRSFCDELRSYLRREEFREMRREFSTVLVTFHVLGDEISSRVSSYLGILKLSSEFSSGLGLRNVPPASEDDVIHMLRRVSSATLETTSEYSSASISVLHSSLRYLYVFYH